MVAGVLVRSLSGSTSVREPTNRTNRGRALSQTHAGAPKINRCHRRKTQEIITPSGTPDQHPSVAPLTRTWVAPLGRSATGHEPALDGLRAPHQPVEVSTRGPALTACGSTLSRLAPATARRSQETQRWQGRHGRCHSRPRQCSRTSAANPAPKPHLHGQGSVRDPFRPRAP